MMIDATNIEYSYEEGRLALAGINLEVQPGEFIAVLGGNGSGKSTLAKHLNALLIPDKGRVVVNGFDTANADTVYQIRSTAGMVFQNPDDQLVASLVEDDVAFGPENVGIELPELRQRVDDALRNVGLEGFEKREAHTLSGGQKQRVAIAGALAMLPSILILDEASAMLDPRGQRDLMNISKSLHEQGMTLIMITHFMEEAAEADRVIVLDHGKIACDGTPQEVLTQEDLLNRLSLHQPFACALAQELRSCGLDISPCVHKNDLVDELLRALPCREEHTQAHSCATQESKTCEPALSSCTQPSETSTNHTDEAHTGKPIISFEHVSYAYDPPAQHKRSKTSTKKSSEQSSDEIVFNWAVEDVSFDIKDGEFFGIAGHTGSGKSTLIQQMNGILQPTEGRVIVQGKDIADRQESASIRTDVGVVFQYPERQLFADTVYNDIAFGPRNLKLSSDEVDARVQEALQLVQLNSEAIGKVSPFALSGGQQRRVALAGVLAMHPRILVLDEPLAGLDPAGRQEFLELISTLHKQGRTVVMISHRMDDLAQRCDRMLVLNEGKLYALGTPEEVFLNAGDLRAVGLELPAAQRMANTLIAHGIPLSSRMLYDTKSLACALVNQAKS